MYPLALVCRRFQASALRLHYSRIVEASTLPDSAIALASAKIKPPYLFCTYIGTDGLEHAGLEPSLKEMHQLYSRFRPVFGDENRLPRDRFPIRSVIGGADQPRLELASHEVHLDVGELFAQLCTIMNVVKLGPKQGLFLSCVNVFDGVIRLWRKWLANATNIEAAEGKENPRASLALGNSDILWIDQAKNVGLRMRVTTKPDLRHPILVERGDEPGGEPVDQHTEELVDQLSDEPSVSYTLEYEGMFPPAISLGTIVAFH